MPHKLSQIKAKQSFRILHLPKDLASELLRLGIGTGEDLECIAKIPGGPIVIKKDLQEIAIGQKFAQEIEVLLNE